MQRIFDFVNRVETVLLSGGILLIAFFIVLNVFTRAAFNTSLGFTEEVSQFLIILVCFTGLSYAASQGRHIRMTAFYDQLNRRGRKRLMLAISAFTALLMFYLTAHALHYVSIVWSLGSVSPVLQMPLYLVYLVAPFGLFLAGIQYACTFYRNLREEDVYLSYTHKDAYETPATGGV